MRGWKALVAVASNEWRFCFFQLLQGRKGAGLWARCGGRKQMTADCKNSFMSYLANFNKVTLGIAASLDKRSIQ